LISRFAVYEPASRDYTCLPFLIILSLKIIINTGILKT